MKKMIDSSWDYADADTKYYTHGVHPYPAMMIPQVSKRLIEANEGAEVGLDPFCGSGSVLLEFKLAGVLSYGVDINPLAVLVSRVKTTPINPEELKVEYEKILREINSNKALINIEEPIFFNIKFWFNEEPRKKLVILKNSIEQIENSNIKDFFLLCFSEVVRRSSNTRGSEFKLFRIPEAKLLVHHPNPFLIFDVVVKRNISGMAIFYKHCKEIQTAEARVIVGDVTQISSIPKKSVDLIVTSPPYGDSRTTVAYGQFSRLSLQWLGFPDDDIKLMDKRMLGGIAAKSLEFNFNSPTLEKITRKISEIDDLRARDVLSFFIDFQKGASNVNNFMSNHSTICLVVGNRTVKGINIPTDEIMSEIFEEFDYIHSTTVIRSIPSKKMPKRNSPTNEVGITSTTMNNEYILILKRK